MPPPLQPTSPPTLPARRRVLVAAATLAFAGRAQASADARLKARLLLNLLRFVQWPAAAWAGTDALVVVVPRGIAPDTADAFSALSGEQAGGRPLRLVVNPTALPPACHALYVAAEAERGAAGLIAEAAARPVLLVGDGDGFVQRGMVGIVNVDDRLRFDVHLGRLRASQLQMSSQVLRLARVVHEA
jgi:hypothetical protein